MDLERITGRYMVVKNGEQNGGHQVILRFGNGYGASIVRGPYTYGGRDGLFEVAVLLFDGEGEEWSLCYSTPITDDVLGWLTWEQVTETCEQIEALPPAAKAVEASS